MALCEQAPDKCWRLIHDPERRAKRMRAKINALDASWDQPPNEIPQSSYAHLAIPELPEPKPAVGRNDPCPCGSGKKFKKCCGA